MTQKTDFSVDALFAAEIDFGNEESIEWGLPGDGQITLTARTLSDTSLKLLSAQIELPEGSAPARALLAAVGFEYAHLPEPLAGALALRLGEIVGVVDGSTLLSLSVPLGFPGRHPILPGLLEIDDPALRFQFDRPDTQTPFSVDVELGAHVDIAGARMELRGGFLLPPGQDADNISRETLRRDLNALMPEGDPDDPALDAEEVEEFLNQYHEAQTKLTGNGLALAFFIEGRLEEVVDLGALLGRFGWPSLSEAKVVRLDFSYHSLSAAYDFEAEISEAIVACNGALALEEVGLAIHGRAGADGGLSGEISALLRLNDTHVAISAQGGADIGWLFRGAIMNIDSKGFALLLEKEFKIKVPDALKAFEIDLLDVEVDLADERLTLYASGRFALSNDTEHKALTVLAVELSHDGQGWHETFSGHLVIDVGTADEPDELSFALDLSHDDTTTDLVATFHDPEGEPFDVGRAVRSVWPSAPLLPKIDLHIPAAGLIHHAPAKGDSETLFALDVDGGIDLSNITLPSLPVPTGADLSVGLDKLRLNVHLFALATGHTPSDTLKMLAAANGFSLPDTSSDRQSALIADVNICFGETVLSQPVAVAPPSEGGDGKLQKAEDAPSSSGIREPTWFDIDKRFGPMQVDRLGISMEGATVTAQIEAALSMAGLSLSLDGLALSAELTDLSSARFSFSGLGIDYANPPLEIGGALFVKDFDGETGYAGEAILRTEALSLLVAGEFRQHQGHPSLLLFGLFDEPLGGPGFFFVTGLAAGLGYNRAVKVPDIGKVSEFPLVLAATSPEDKTRPTNPGDALTKMGSDLPPAIGEHFLAVGVNFTSFKVVDSFALLIGREHERLEFDLLGMSSISQPFGAAKPLAKARIAWLAHFSPEEGILTLRAEILPGAYVFAPACHLKGGFAASFWFCEQRDKAIPAGDFALTLGGYHPAYKVPMHYPRVTPLTLEWQVNKHLRIKGQAYMALTSNAVMAGGRLEATWHDTDIRVYFVAGADFLLCWEPYHYDIQVSISLRASITVHFFTTWTIDFDASARLHLWGPEFAGEAEVHLKVVGVDVSFHVAFNTASKRPEALDWDAFCTSFLPATTIPKVADRAIEGAITLACAGGLIGQTKQGEWIVAASKLVVNITSPVPATSLQGSKVELLDKAAAHPGIAPMGIRAQGMKSDLKITIKGPGGELHIHTRHHSKQTPEVNEAAFLLKPTRGNLPAATWGQSRPNVVHKKVFISPPRLSDPSLVQDVLVGAQLSPSVHTHQPVLHPANGHSLVECRPDTDLSWNSLDLPLQPRIAGAGAQT